MAKAMAVANYLIHLRDRDEKRGQYFSLSNLKLQKLLYYCQGGHYMWDEKKLIEDELFEAWDYGPVIADVYKEFKKYGQNDIYNEVGKVDLTKDERETIEAIWEQLKEKHPFDLVKSTHSESPWLDARACNRIFIPNTEIRNFFTREDS